MIYKAWITRAAKEPMSLETIDLGLLGVAFERDRLDPIKDLRVACRMELPEIADGG
jgi:hypothetical protein